MLVLGIIAFALETIVFSVVYGLNLVDEPLTVTAAWLVVLLVAACVAMSIVALVGNIKALKTYYQRGKHITGIVFSGVALLEGAIFFISFMIGFLAAL